MELLSAILFIFDMTLDFFVAINDSLASVHWILPWIAGVVLAMPICKFWYKRIAD